MFSILGKKITVVGAQRSGMSAVHLAFQKGGIVKLSDHGQGQHLTEDFLTWAKKNEIIIELGGHTQSFIEDSDIVVISPGVRIDAPVVKWAIAKNIPVVGEIEFAFQFCSKPVIAVTGSNGKTTTVTLIHDVFNAAGLKTVLCGNVGKPFSQFVGENSVCDFYVLEVSSFQMESLLDKESLYRQRLGFSGFKPKIAVVLNFSQNHLDRHKDLQEYFEAKTRIFMNQGLGDFSIVNAQNEQLCEFAKGLSSGVEYFNSLNAKFKNPNHDIVTVIAKIVGVSTSTCEEVFKNFKGVEHRLEFVRNIDGVDYINDSKATTAESGRWALEQISRPIVMVCGGRDKHIDFSVLKDLVSRKVNKMIVIGEAKKVLKDIFHCVVSIEEGNDMKDAVLRAKAAARSGDCVLLCPMCASFDMFRDYEDRGQVFKEIVRGI